MGFSTNCDSWYKPHTNTNLTRYPNTRSCSIYGNHSSKQIGRFSLQSLIDAGNGTTLRPDWRSATVFYAYFDGAFAVASDQATVIGVDYADGKLNSLVMERIGEDGSRRKQSVKFGSHGSYIYTVLLIENSQPQSRSRSQSRLQSGSHTLLAGDNNGIVVQYLHDASNGTWSVTRSYGNLGTGSINASLRLGHLAVLGCNNGSISLVDTRQDKLELVGSPYKTGIDQIYSLSLCVLADAGENTNVSVNTPTRQSASRGVSQNTSKSTTVTQTTSTDQPPQVRVLVTGYSPNYSDTRTDVLDISGLASTHGLGYLQITSEQNGNGDNSSQSGSETQSEIETLIQIHTKNDPSVDAYSRPPSKLQPHGFHCVCKAESTCARLITKLEHHMRDMLPSLLIEMLGAHNAGQGIVRLFC